MKRYNSEQYELDAMDNFRMNYPSYAYYVDNKTETIEILDDGTIYIGWMEFKLDFTLLDYEMK